MNTRKKANSRKFFNLGKSKSVNKYNSRKMRKTKKIYGGLRTLHLDNRSTKDTMSQAYIDSMTQEQCDSVQEIYIHGYGSNKTDIPNLTRFVNVKKITIEGSAITKFNANHIPSSIEELEISQTDISTISGLRKFTLARFTLFKNESLTNVTDFPNLSDRNTIEITSCPKLAKLPDRFPENLKSLKLIKNHHNLIVPLMPEGILDYTVEYYPVVNNENRSKKSRVELMRLSSDITGNNIIETRIEKHIAGIKQINERYDELVKENLDNAFSSMNISQVTHAFNGMPFNDAPDELSRRLDEVESGIGTDRFINRVSHRQLGKRKKESSR